MGTVYKILGAVTVAANADTVLYTTPNTTATVVSSFVVCNTGSSAATFSASVRGASTALSSYIYYQVPLASKDTFISTAGLTLEAAKKISVESSSTGVVFSAYGSEIS